MRSGSGGTQGRPGRRSEHRVTGNERRVHRRRSAGRRPGSAWYRGVVMGQRGGVVVPVHAGPARLGRRRLRRWGASSGGGGEVEESGVVDGAERR